MKDVSDRRVGKIACATGSAWASRVTILPTHHTHYQSDAHPTLLSLNVPCRSWSDRCRCRDWGRPPRSISRLGRVRDRITAFCTAVQNVRFWHKADIPRLSSNVRYWGKADIAATLLNVRF